MYKHFPGGKDRTDEFFGWDQLGAAVVELAKENPGFELASNRCQIAAEIMMYAEMPLTCFHVEGRPNQFDIWQDRSTFQGKNYLYFNDSKTPKPSVAAAFERFEYLTTIPMKRGDTVIREIHVYKGHNYIRQEG